MKKVVIALILVVCALGIVFMVHNNKQEKKSNSNPNVCTESGEC